MEQAEPQAEHREPQAPQPRPRTYVYIGSTAVPTLESYEEIEAKLEEVEPNGFIELTINVSQPEVQNHGNAFFQMLGVSLREGFTRARYRESYITGYIEILPPPAE